MSLASDFASSVHNFQLVGNLVCLCILPMAEMLKEKVEEFFGCEYELCIEFTGLIRFSLCYLCNLLRYYVSTVSVLCTK